MYCWKCGKENRDSAAFCRYCGVSLNMATKNSKNPANDQLSKDAADKTLDLVLAVSIDKSQYYKTLLRKIEKEFDTLENIDDLAEEALGKYLRAVAFSVFDIFIQQSSDFRPLIQEALENPAIFGYEDIDFSAPRRRHCPWQSPPPRQTTSPRRCRRRRRPRPPKPVIRRRT